jgi:methyl-accepting chemotaxis protein
LKSLTVKSKILLLLTVSALGLLTFGSVALATLGKIQIDGDLYKEIKLGQDILADYVPPPEGIAYVVTILVSMEEAPDRATIEQNVQTFRQARKDFEERHAYYMKTVPEGRL